MKNMRIICVTTVSAALAIGSAQASTVVNFDAAGIGTLTDVTTQYAPQGVTFSGVDWSGNTVNIEAANNSLYSDVNPTSAPNALSDFYGGSQGNRAKIIQMDFTSGATGVSFEYNPAGGLGVNTVFNVYGPSGLVDSFSDPNASGDGVYYLESIPANVGTIDEIDIVAPTQGWGHYVDDLTFDKASASAPDGGTTAGLLGVAFTAMAALRRKASK
jgi:hypothetical protein